MGCLMHFQHESSQQRNPKNRCKLQIEALHVISQKILKVQQNNGIKTQSILSKLSKTEKN